MEPKENATLQNLLAPVLRLDITHDGQDDEL